MFSASRRDNSQDEGRSHKKTRESISKPGGRILKKRKTVSEDEARDDADNRQGRVKKNTSATVDVAKVPSDRLNARLLKNNEKQKSDQGAIVDGNASNMADNAAEQVPDAQTEKKKKKKEKKKKAGNSKDIEQEATQDLNSEMQLDESIEQEQEQEQEQEAVPSAERQPQRVLHAFPDFLPQKPTAFDIAAKRLMGVPDWLANPTVVAPETTAPISEFDRPHFLSKRLLKRCEDLGIEEFFAVQTAVFPAFLKSRNLSDAHLPPGDLCVSAPTGSGKTLAYVLPIIEILSKRVITRLRALIIVPTRDLVAQVKETFTAFCKGTDLKIGTVTGQHSFAHEQAHLVGDLSENLSGGSSKVDILIATPGRLIDHLNDTPNFSLQHLRYLVIDEADRLLNQSYQDWLATILRTIHLPSTVKTSSEHRNPVGLKVKNDCIPVHDAVAPAFFASIFKVAVSDIDTHKATSIQKLLFSATLTRNPAKIASLHLQNPQYIAVQVDGQVGKDNAVGEKYTTPSGLREHMLVCSSDQKPLLVLHLLHNMQVTAALCFTKSVESAHRLFLLVQLFEKIHAKQESDGEVSEQTVAAEYSSDLSQVERNAILRRFKKGEIRLLICSDLIARGIDLDRVDAVISYDVPIYMKKYIHRVGRTARAGREGDAYSLVEEQEVRHFKEMLSKAGHLDKVKKVNWTANHVEALVEAYRQSLESLRKLVTNAKPSVAKYQGRMTSSFVHERGENRYNDRFDGADEG